MINHLSIGVRDLARAKRFYDAALAPLGLQRLSDGETFAGYGKDGQSALWLLQSSKPVPPDADSGLHICLDAPSRAGVDAFHAAALMAGGGDNGAPGIRTAYGDNYYAAFVVDPDGYRLEAYCGAEA
jgi:catechol 2,3-dioxygenase-like lactoylglutathione lyase family enzyme